MNSDLGLWADSDGGLPININQAFFELSQDNQELILNALSRMKLDEREEHAFMILGEKLGVRKISFRVFSEEQET